MPRWAERALALSLAALAACGGGRTEPVYGPVPSAPAPRPAPPPEAPPPARFEPAPAPVVAGPAVRVGVVVDAAAGTISSPSGLTVETESGDNIDELAQGRAVAFSNDGGGIVMTVVDENGSPAGRSRRGLASPVVVRAADGGVVELRGVPYRGAILVQSAGGRSLTFVNRLDVESYLLGVVPRELGQVDESAYEAIKAQAVAARTYAVRNMGRRTEQGFDVYASTADQVYGGVPAERELVSRAVRETAGEVLTYGGRPIDAYYHSTCAGRTAAINEVWNVSPVPYLVSVEDVDPRTGEAYDRSSSRFTWTERWSHEQLVGVLNRTLADSLRGRRIREIEDMDVVSRTQSGRVRALRIETDAGTFTVGRDRVRWILVPPRGGSLNSSKFDIRLERSGGEVVQIVAEGGGWGHGIGMCQVGAMGRARAGQDYRTILGAYYPGTRLERMY
ncbi:MAG TPA: SpoIID/LytB domain-containing protein [Longimicrobium sp.]|nr:SpoIID/LytB domain-containing protein [Longimicrobium sp.]